MQHYFYSPPPPPFESIPPDQGKFEAHLSENFNWQTFQPSECYTSAQYQLPYTNWTSAEVSQDNEFQRGCQTSQDDLFNAPHSWSIQAPDNDLELFAEHFKQRRMKLGVTQADVGKALGTMMIPGVGSLSQSTICRFESLTLSRTNMLALRPLLQIWIDRMEAKGASGIHALTGETGHYECQTSTNSASTTSGTPARRKRTCITDSERRALETYFVVQPQPSGERVGQIASLLGLPKSVVRVWFCNQRQKQKRLKVGISGARIKLGTGKN